MSCVLVIDKFILVNVNKRHAKRDETS